MSESYQTSKAVFLYGGPDFLIDLTDDLDSQFTLGGAVTTDRRRIIASGRVGVTADGVSCGLTASGGFRLGDDIGSVIGQPDGIVAVRMTDASWAYAFPVVLANKSLTSPSRGAVLAAVSWTQRATTLPVAGVPVGPGALTVATGNIGYIVDAVAKKISFVSSSSTVPTGGWGVTGAPWLAEGVT